MSNKFTPALEVIAHEMVATQERLEALELAYEKLGGTYEAAEPEPEATPKRLAGPKSAKAGEAARAKSPDASDAFGVTFDGGQFVALTERQALVVEAMLAADDNLVTMEAIAEHYGPRPFKWWQDLERLNARLAPAQHRVKNVRGSGYRLERVQ